MKLLLSNLRPVRHDGIERRDFQSYLLELATYEQEIVITFEISFVISFVKPIGPDIQLRD